MALIDIVFDGPPGPESGRFIRVEDMAGRSIKVGEWINLQDGRWALRLACEFCIKEREISMRLENENAKLREEIGRLKGATLISADYGGCETL